MGEIIRMNKTLFHNAMIKEVIALAANADRCE